MLKSFSSPGDKQVLPDAIAKTDWTKCAICQQNKVESVPFGFQALVWCWIRVQDLAWKYSKVQGSRFHAYADRSFTARWKGEELERNTLVRCKARWHKVAMISSILGSYNEQKKKTCAWKWTTSSLVESVVYTFSFACISQQWCYTLFCVESILHARTLFTMSQHLV